MKTLRAFGKFVFTEVRSLEWLRLSNITTFFGLYAFIAAVIGILVTANILSVFPSISYRLLPSLLLVDPQEFHHQRYEKERVPDELDKVIGNKPDELVLLSTKKKVFPKEPVFPEGFMYFDIPTGILQMQVGRQDELVRVGDIIQVKRNLGLAEAPGKALTHLTDEQLLFYLDFSSTVKTASGKKIRPGGTAISEIETIIDREESQSFDVWKGLWISSKIVSLVLIENDSDLPASNIHITVGYAGHILGVQPFLLFTQSQSPFKYDQKTNSIDVSRIFPKEQLLLLTLSKSALRHGDLRVSWDRYSEFDRRKVMSWLIIIGLACVALVIMSIIPEYRKRDSILLDTDTQYK